MNKEHSYWSCHSPTRCEICSKLIIKTPNDAVTLIADWVISTEIITEKNRPFNVYLRICSIADFIPIISKHKHIHFFKYCRTETKLHRACFVRFFDQSQEKRGVLEKGVSKNKLVVSECTRFTKSTWYRWEQECHE